jgi:hypothetical protein
MILPIRFLRLILIFGVDIEDDVYLPHLEAPGMFAAEVLDAGVSVLYARVSGWCSFWKNKEGLTPS